MFTGFSNIFKSINERRKICKKGYHGDAGKPPRSTPEFFNLSLLRSYSICLYLHTDLVKILKLILMTKDLYFDISEKFDKFLKNNLENVEIFSYAGIF